MSSILSIPVIDIESLVLQNSDPCSVKNTVSAIGKSCKEWGFFYIVGHQIDTGVIENFQRVSREFFSKPQEFKGRVARTATNLRGFSDAEFTKQKLDWKEVFDFGSEVNRRENVNLDFDGDNQWPVEMPEFKDALLKYFEEIHSVGEKLMSAIFESLGVDPEPLRAEFKESRATSVMRMNYYPICPDSSAHLGVGPHADPSALTILWQDMEVTSLQVEKDGVFYNVHPLKDSFVVNIGDMVQVWSNGLYKAPVHRVLANHIKPRYSAPFFYTPSYSCNVAPVDPLITEVNPCRYRPINWGEFRRGRFQGDYADVGEEIQIKHYLIPYQQHTLN